MVEYVCNPSTFEAEAGGSRGINCHPHLPRVFEASLGYTKQRKKRLSSPDSYSETATTLISTCGDLDNFTSYYFNNQTHTVPATLFCFCGACMV